MPFDPAVTDGLVIGALVLGLVALVVAVRVARRTSAMRRDYVLLQADRGADDFVTVVARKNEEVAALRDEVQRMRSQVDRFAADLSDAIRHVSVVRYDAFGDAGGRLSFSAALLDDAGDGLVLTSIHGRAETRTYVKGVTSGAAGTELSPEEEQAVKLALGPAPAGAQ